MSQPDEDGSNDDTPVFVGNRGYRRRVTATVGLLVSLVVLAGSSVVGAALVSHGPSGSPHLGPTRPTDRSMVPFGIDTEQLAPATPAGAEPCRSVEGTVFADLDGNGIRSVSTEEGLPDVEVEVVDAEGHHSSAVTDQDGSYRVVLDTLSSSTLRVQFRGVSDQLIATPVGPGAHPWLTLVSGGPTCQVDSAGLFKGWWSQKGLHSTPVREIGDRVWLDEDGDGIQDPDEPGIADVDLELLGPDGAVLAKVSTSASGEYRFAGLRADSAYVVRVVSSPSDATGPLGGLEPTTALVGTSLDGVTIAGASGWDSNLGAGPDPFAVLVPTAELGASDHSIDLGLRPAT